MAIITEEDFKGYPMLVIKKDETDTWPFKVGVKKAQLLLENLDAIGAFVDRHTTPPSEG
jgi:hypothetical protein